MTKAIILSGYGINCEEETKFAFELAGAQAKIVHINDLIAKKDNLKNYSILAFPGGFSYGDDTGSGNAFANKIKNNLWKELNEFLDRDTLTIGICNGFQIITNLGIIPAIEKREPSVALTHNKNARYINRWVDLKPINTTSPWLKDLKEFPSPIAHGEGRFFAEEKTLNQLEKNNQIALVYTKGEICNYQNLEPNPNGSLREIAGILDKTGKVLGLMPHPERALFFSNQPNFYEQKELKKRKKQPLPTYGPGLQIFKNAVDYFSKPN